MARERGAVSSDGVVVTVLVAAVHVVILYASLMQPASAPLLPRPMAVEVTLQADAAKTAVNPKAAKPERSPEASPDASAPKPPEPDAGPQEADPPARANVPDTNPALTYADPDYQAAYLNNPLPAYPMVARRMGLQGKVVLNVEVLETGKCGEVSVLQSSGHEVLDNAALETVKSWSFTPAREGGRAITRWFKVPIVFSLRDAK